MPLLCNLSLPVYRHGAPVSPPLKQEVLIQNGKLAAHIKLLEPSSNNTVSLFMTSNDEDLEQLDNKQRTIDGLDVKLWRE